MTRKALSRQIKLSYLHAVSNCHDKMLKIHVNRILRPTCYRHLCAFYLFSIVKAGVKNFTSINYMSLKYLQPQIMLPEYNVL